MAEPINGINSVVPGKHDRSIIACVLAIIVLLLSIQAYIFRHWMVDDSFISLRFSRNFADGYGLIYNVGERVEGYSCFLWVFLLGCLGKIGLDIVQMAKLVGAASCLFVMYLLYKIALERTNSKLFALILPLLIASNFGYVFFAVTGMESVFCSALLTAGVTLFIRHKMRLTISSALLFSAAALTRPECIAYLMVFSAIGIIGSLRGTSNKGASGLPRTLAAVLLGLGVYGVFLLWRHSYYGEWVPNTFYAKPPGSGGESGIPFIGSVDDIARFFNAIGGGLSVLFVLVAIAVKSIRAWIWPYVLLISVGFAFQVYTGGDWMANYRYLIPILPAYALVEVIGIHACVRLLSTNIGDVHGKSVYMIAYLGILTICGINLTEVVRMHQEREKYPNFVLCSQDMVSAARWIHQHAPPSWTINNWRIGALGYYSGIKLIDDGYGLTDKYIAKLVYQKTFNQHTVKIYLEKRNMELYLSAGNPGIKPRTYVSIGKLKYRFIKAFKQGSDQMWLLYLRSDISPQQLLEGKR